jgi:hypothetical protein
MDSDTQDSPQSALFRLSGNSDGCKSFAKPFVGTLFQDLMERSGTELGTRGMHRFTDAHMLYVLCLCRSGRISRQELAERTGVGEGTVRNILACLRRLGLVDTIRRGSALTSEGTSLVEEIGIEIPEEQPLGILDCKAEFVLLAHGKGHLMDSDIKYRDGAIMMGASVCMPFRMDGGKVTVPYYDAVQLEYPDLSELAERIGMGDGDAGMLCGADSIQVASSAAFGGMLKLLG